MLLINFGLGLFVGYLAELSYRFKLEKRYIKPLFINLQMYGFSAAFLYFIYSHKISLMGLILLALLFTTGIEFITGYSYLKIKGVRLWNYFDENLNYKGLICLRFSLYWLLIFLVYYFLVDFTLGWVEFLFPNIN